MTKYINSFDRWVHGNPKRIIYFCIPAGIISGGLCYLNIASYLVHEYQIKYLGYTIFYGFLTVCAIVSVLFYPKTRDAIVRKQERIEIINRGKK